MPSRLRPQQFPEKCVVVWLDADINESHRNFQFSMSQLRRVVNSIEIFTHADSCIDYVTNIKNHKVFIIVSETFGEQIVPLINNIPQLDSIYVFGDQMTVNREWMKDHHKVKGVFAEIKPLCVILKRHVYQADVDLTVINIISASSVIDLNQLDQSFMYSQLLKEILLKIEHDKIAKSDFVEFCRMQHADNQSGIDVIDEFERDYDRSSAIWWYTRDCFIYTMINRALRTQDIEIIIKMGFFVQDLHRQIEHLYSSADNHIPLTVYRGQGMFSVEFEKIYKSGGGLLSFNSFLSTSIDRQVSFLFADSARQDPDLLGVLFQIKIDPSISTTPFASLDNVGYYMDSENSEKEILFSMHTVFRIGEVKQIENRLWEVKLTLTSDNDERLKNLTEHMRQEIGGGIEWAQLGSLMVRMGELKKAEEIYQTLLDSATDNTSINKGCFHHSIGLIMIKKGDPNTAVSHLERALEIFKSSLTPNHPELAATYNNIGWVHQSIREYPNALSNFEKAFQIRQKSLSPNHPDLAASYNNIGSVYRLMEDYSTAVTYYKTGLKIFQKSLPPNHPDLVSSHNNIGELQQTMGHYPNAISHFEQALAIAQESLPSNHPGLASLHTNIGKLYRLMAKYSTALIHSQKALEIFHKSLPPSHPKLATLHNNIGEVHRLIGEYSIALSHFRKALEIQQENHSNNQPDLATSHNNIGEVHRAMGEYSNAVPHLEKALEIQQQTLPANHSQLATTHNNIGELYRCIGKYSAALLHFNKALEIRQISLPSSHSEIAVSQNNIGVVHQLIGEYSIAISYYQKALEIFKKSLPSSHPNLATLRNNLGDVYRTMGNYLAALSCFEKALETQQKSLPFNHSDLAITHNNVGVVHKLMGDYSTALSHFRKALEIQKISLSSDHSNLATSYNNIGEAYRCMQDNSTALSYYEKAIRIFQKSLPPNHPDLGAVHSNIAMVYQDLNRYEEAIQHSQKAVDIATVSSRFSNSQVQLFRDHLEKLLRGKE